MPSLPPANSAGACPRRGLSRAALARPATVENSMGACLARHVLSLPLVCFLPPIPPTPFPAGRGGFRLFHARGFAPCIPGAEPEAALTASAQTEALRGACPRAAWWQGANHAPGGGAGGEVACRPCHSGTRRGACLSPRPPTQPFALFLPPSPRPPSSVGKGETKVIFMQGASPLASPGLSRRRHLQTLPKQKPCGGLAFLLARLPCLSRCFCPHPPDPLPAGKGESQSLFRRGLRPRHPGIKPPAALTEPAAVVPGGAGFAPGGGLNPGGTCYPCPGREDHLKRRRSVSDG